MVVLENWYMGYEVIMALDGHRKYSRVWKAHTGHLQISQILIIPELMGLPYLGLSNCQGVIATD